MKRQRKTSRRFLAQPRQMNVFAQPIYTGEAELPLRPSAMDAYRIPSLGPFVTATRGQQLGMQGLGY